MGVCTKIDGPEGPEGPGWGIHHLRYHKIFCRDSYKNELKKYNEYNIRE